MSWEVSRLAWMIRILSRFLLIIITITLDLRLSLDFSARTFTTLVTTPTAAAMVALTLTHLTSVGLIPRWLTAPYLVLKKRIASIQNPGIPMDALWRVLQSPRTLSRISGRLRLLMSACI